MVVGERGEAPSASPFYPHSHHTPNKEKDGTHLHNNSRQDLHGNNYPKNPLLTVATAGASKEDSGGGRRAWGFRGRLPFIPKLKEVLTAGTKASQSLTKPGTIGRGAGRRPKGLEKSCSEAWLQNTLGACASLGVRAELSGHRLSRHPLQVDRHSPCLQRS